MKQYQERVRFEVISKSQTIKLCMHPICTREERLKKDTEKECFNVARPPYDEL